MYRIGEFSKLSRTTVKTLRFYAEEGLLSPAKVDRVTGYRYYETAQLADLYRIQQLRQTGLSIEDIRQLITEPDPKRVLVKKRTELRQTMDTLQSQLVRIESLLGEIDSMTYTVTIKTIPEYIVFSRTMHLHSYSDMMQKIPETGALLAEANPGLKCVSPDYCFCRHLDNEYRETDITSEYCQAVVSAGNPVDDIVFKTIPETTVASVLHKGPYETLNAAYAYILKWIEDNGYVCCETPRESYIDGIWNKESPEDWLTEIQVPVTPRSAHR
ncbi:MAG TPA: MerR family transcriptional regulator [Methanocorpusculum sp.]|nr:MerR family transcriptional regulator [Methanocorpusculum sp.]